MDPKILRTREVPWYDLSYDPNGFMPGVREISVMSLDDLSVDLVCPSAKVPDSSNGRTQIYFGRIESLAIVECFEGSQFFRMLLYEVCELVEKLPAAGSRHLETP